jgi:hypothetical protein
MRSALAAVSEAMDDSNFLTAEALQPLALRALTCLPSPVDTAAATVTPAAPRASRAASAAFLAAEAVAKAAINAAVKADADLQAARCTFNAASELSDAQLAPAPHIQNQRHTDGSQGDGGPGQGKCAARARDRAQGIPRGGRRHGPTSSAWISRALACSLINDDPGKNRPHVATLHADGLLRLCTVL